MRKIHEDAVNVLIDFLSNQNTERLFNYLVQVSSEWNCPSNVTSNIIHETLQVISEDIDGEILKEDYEAKLADFKSFLNLAGLVPNYMSDDEADSMSKPFEEYISQYTQNIPKGKDLSVELITLIFFYLLGISDSDDSEILVRSPTLKELNSSLREKANYNSLLDEYDSEQLEASEDILKSLEPVDVSNLPEYVIDSLYLHSGKFYRPSEVRKMITASSQTAQALEEQDLEDDNEELGLTAEELGRRYIKKLKVKRDRK